MAAAATKSTLCSVSSDLVTDALHFFDQSVRTDHWGQIVEATDSYQRCVSGTCRTHKCYMASNTILRVFMCFLFHAERSASWRK